MHDPSVYDVAVIGGGPAGAAAGTQLAKSGKKVIILEKEKFPRFCIGESLLPHGNDLLRTIGVWTKLEKSGFLQKFGAEFCTGDTNRLQRFWFKQNLGPSHEYSYQVDRSQFDQLLLNHARETGCHVSEETRVISLDQSNPSLMTLSCERPEEAGGPMKITSRWIIDASGRYAFSGSRLGLRRKSTQKKRRVAIYGHFEGVFRNSGKAAGHITIVRIPEGWFWLIPLAGNRTSVGLVIPSEFAGTSAERGVEKIFHEMVASTPEVNVRMRGAVGLQPLRVTGDYSWKFSSFATPRIILTGDAAGFVDPIFSSGIMLALKSALRASELILRAEAAHRSLRLWERIRYTCEVTGWMNHYARIIGAFYDRAGFEVFMNPSPLLQIPRSIARLVGGEANPGFLDRMRLNAFLLICRVQRFWSIAPSISWLR